MQAVKRRTLYKILFTLLTIIALSLTWRWAVQTGSVDADQVGQWLSQWRSAPRWQALLITTLLFVALLQVFFPLTVLVVASGAIFGPVWGSVYATAGTLASSAVCFWVGVAVGEPPLRQLQGRLIARASAYMSQRSVRAMIIINLLPIAPFTLTNLLAGAVRMPFARYMLGSTIGILPGLIAVTVFGAQLMELLTAQSAGDVAVAVSIALLAALALWFIPRALQRRRAQQAPQHKID